MARVMDWPPAALHETKRISGLTHGFYRYPATTSPLLVREILQKFTVPGDLVLDPYMGGGTSIVEALAHGRRAVGLDINPLAVMIASAKATPLNGEEWDDLECWAGRDPFSWETLAPADERTTNFPDDMMTPFRRALASLELFDSAAAETAARCALLAIAKWAVEARRSVLPHARLSERLARKITTMRRGMDELVRAAGANGIAAPQIPDWRQLRDQPAEEPPLMSQPIKLVLTSPPYPGVHVLYHRWQVQGRRETPAAYWLADRQDGCGATYYTLGGRSRSGQERYFERITATFKAIRPALATEAIVVQVVGFHDITSQLPRYLEAMDSAGYGVVMQPDQAGSYRYVPNRRWYTAGRPSDSAIEVILAHRPKRLDPDRAP
ncbi:MAG: hypothetical protein HS107_13895 [Thermoflexaceae bacterium]|nr:hypothetical protein [Thermoflexaceae bacterium]